MNLWYQLDATRHTYRQVNLIRFKNLVQVLILNICKIRRIIIDNYIHLDEIAAILGFAPATIRAFKSVSGPELHPVRLASDNLRSRTIVYQIEEILTWLKRSLPRVSPSLEMALRERATPLNSN